jgi:hypothetical protein
MIAFAEEALPGGPPEDLRDPQPQAGWSAPLGHRGWVFRGPGRIRTTDIARKQGLPRTTFEDRLRRAEGKVLHAVAPYLVLYIGKEGL